MIGVRFPKKGKEGKMGRDWIPISDVLNILCLNCSSVLILFSLSPYFILYSHEREKKVHSITFPQAHSLFADTVAS